MLVKDWMTTYVYTATPDTGVSEVMHLMKEKKIKHVPVTDSAKKVLGVISDRDIKEFAPSKGTSLDIFELNYLLAKTKAKEVMRAPVTTAEPGQPIEEAAMLLFDKGIGCLPVVEDGVLVGILSDRDIFRVLVDITGVRNGGIRVSLALPDSPGTIKTVADLLRKHGFRQQSILSSNEKAAPGQRYVVIRTLGQGDFPALKAELAAAHPTVRIMETENSPR